MKKDLIFILLLCCNILFAQNPQSLPKNDNHSGLREVRIDLDSSSTEGLERLVNFLKKLETDPKVSIKKVEIEVMQSPEKGKTQSEQLSLDRVNEIWRYIKSNSTIPDSLIWYKGGIAWTELRNMVAMSNMQYRDKVINIIDSIPEDTRIGNKLLDSRNKRLMDLEGGRPYIYMREHFFPKLISTDVVISYSLKEASVRIRRHFSEGIAIKSNLLYFAALAPNIGVEYNFISKNSEKWSLGLSFTVPWWRSKSKHTYYHLPFLEIDSKYYFGKTQRHNIGLYGHGGKYDLKSSKEGSIGSVGGFGGVGFAYGYLLPIADCLSLNFEIGVGYIYTIYKQYAYSETEKDYYYIDASRKSKTKHLFIPTKAGVTLVWEIGKFYTRGGNK